MTFIPKNALYPYVLTAVFSFLLMISSPCALTFYHSPHDHTRMSQTVHKVHGHGDCSNSHLSNIHGCHDADSSHECCENESQNSDECTRDSVLRNRTNTTERTQSASLSAPIVVDFSQFSGRTYLSEGSNPKNPTLSSLRTVVLLQ